MSLLRITWLGLAVWGATQPAFHLLRWLQANGFDLTGLIGLWRASEATTSMMWNLVIATIALVVFILAEVAVRRNWGALIAVPATLVLGIGCGLPLYLFLRTSRIR